GYIHSRVMSDSSRIGEIISWGVNEGLWQITYLIFAFVVMFVIDPALAIIVATVIPAITVVYALFQKKLVRINREIRETNAKITGDYNEGITGAKNIKTLVIEKLMTDSFKEDTDNLKKKQIHGSVLRGAFSATMHFASSVGLALVLWKGGILAANEVGTFSLFMSYAEGIVEPVRWVVDMISDLISTQVNIERVTRILETEPDVYDSPEVIEKYGDTFNPKKENWEELKGDIEFKNVDFMYPDGDEYVLENFNLHIPFGTNVAIVGETGAGKSTLANLICRFYEPTSGQLLIDGRDARERSQLWLHSSLGYVLQTPHLFSGTVRDNLLYGNSDATDEQIHEAISLVSADQVIADLPNGLDTDVGEGGGMLSTGEKQLISFARALLADPKILVLDEATASVDTITEKKIQAAIDKVIKGRTSIVIAHRLSTIRDADIILVVKKGKIVEQGTHEELLAMNGYYKMLYTRQFEDEATEALLSSKMS
ncbi:MAG: ABC transporter ATP-binding protein, partial [Lachnospiraceae bacterium]|nr:ABC transporter ATP-binding protein [Candidatus Minthocola equi]